MRKPLVAAFALALFAIVHPGSTDSAAAQSMRLEPLGADEIYQASGNEPFWSATIQGEAIRFEHAGAIEVSGSYADPVRSAGTTAYIGRIEQRSGDMVENYPTGLPLIVLVEDRPCADSMAGTPYPNTVRIVVANNLFSGCGGNAADALAGAEWTVTRLTDTPVSGDPAMTIVFNRDGSAAGSGGCNRFGTRYEMDDGFGFGPVMSTRRGCPGAVGENEQRFFTAMRDVIGIDLNEDGSITLYSEHGPVITLDR
ncbi:MAG: META domain-containing protein [Sphingomonadaceae bacterium]|nr:META domain-containing protein [Sphingomonadaceae bacterium]